jgi:hypothetical protein
MVGRLPGRGWLIGCPTTIGGAASARWLRPVAEIKDLDHLFEMRPAADMRAIERWQAAAPGRELTLPDHTKLCKGSGYGPVLPDRRVTRQPRHRARRSDHWVLGPMAAGTRPARPTSNLQPQQLSRANARIAATQQAFPAKSP